MRISDWSSDVCSSDLLVVRFEKEFRESIDQVRDLFISLPGGGQVPLREVAEVELRDAPAQISRDNAKRRIVIGVNTRGGDTEGIVEHIRERLECELVLPPGYYVSYGGQFENIDRKSVVSGKV